MIIVTIFILILAIVLIKQTIKWFKVNMFYGFVSLLGNLFIWCVVSYCVIVPFVVIDNNNGMIEGKITHVEKNFGGSYTIYLKTDKQEKYCVEDKDLIEFAKKLEGRQVILGKTTREGIYGFKYCHEAPIEHIERVTNEK